MVDGQPIVLPVDCAVQGEIVVFRTGEGTKLKAAHGTKVAFEVDTCTSTRGAVGA